MKIKIPVKYRERVEKLSAMNTSFNALMDDMISDLAKTLNLAAADEYEILWDHILNGSTWTVEYEDDVVDEYEDDVVEHQD
jgi:hypothetical protein